MKRPIQIPESSHMAALLVAVMSLGMVTGQAADPVPTNGTPKIQFDSTVYDFNKVVGGEAVRHDYYFTNTGTALLKLNSVNASCGCTTAGQWTREVPPGGTGMVPIQFNSGNFSGAVTKMATVACNDPATPYITLQIKGTVWRPVEVSPTMAMLNVNSELISNATAVVRITNHAGQPLEVYEPVSSNPQFAAELRTNTPGKLFEIVIRSVPPLDIANPHGTITVRTSSTNTPTLAVSAMCVIQPAVAVNPPRVVIQEAHLTNQWSGKVTLRSGLNRPLQLSNPAVNVPGGKAEIRELEAGRLYEVALIVPPAAKDSMKPVELTMTSNFPEYETVRVPIMVVNSSNAVTAHGIPMTARANKYLSSPAGRRALEPKPEEEDYLPADEGTESHEGHDHAQPAPK